MGVNGIYGLSGSGIDIESMVKVGMMSKQNEYDKMAQKYTKNEWIKTAFIDINNQLTTFNLSSLTEYKLSSNMNAKTATSSNESAVKVTANGAAAIMSHRVDVDKLSSNAYLISGKSISQIVNENNNWKDDDVKAEMRLRDIMFSGLTSSPTITSKYDRIMPSPLTSGDTITYGSSNGVITQTAITRNNDGITVKYTPTSGAIDKRTYAYTYGDEQEKTINATFAGRDLNPSVSPSTSTSTTSETKHLYTREVTVDDGNGGTTTTTESAWLNDTDYNNNNNNYSTNGWTYKGKEETTSTTNETTKTITLNGSGGTITITGTETTSSSVFTAWDSTNSTYGSSDPAVETTTSNVSYALNGIGSTDYADGTLEDDGVITFGTLNNAPTIKLTTTDGTNYTAEINFDLKNTDGNPNATSSLSASDMTGASKIVTETTYANGVKKETTEGGVTSSEITLYNSTDKTKLVATNDGSGNKTININYDKEDNTSRIATITEKNSPTDGILATTEIGESGISASTNKAANGTRTSINEPFASGKAASAVSGDAKAIAFTIGDGKSDNVINISYTYNQLLSKNSTTNSYLSIYDLVSSINSQASAKNINIEAKYEEESGRFFLFNTKSSTEDKIEINITAEDNGQNYAATATKNFLEALNLAQSTGGQLVNPSDGSTPVTSSSQNGSGLKFDSDGKATAAGTYGKVRIDGVEYDNVKDNKLTIFGVTYNFTNTTTTTDPTTGQEVSNPVTVNATQDVDAIVDKVKSFVESYNKILESLYEKYNEKPDSGYKPLTQSQKDAMKEDQIEKWEEKAKQGLLYHDQTLGKIINQMREAITTTVEGIDSKFTSSDGREVTYNSVFSIGISTTGYSGKLVLNEDKLRNALDVDPDSVYNIFARLTNETEKVNGKTQANRNGIVTTDGVAQRLGDILTNATKLIKSRAGSTADVSEDSDINNLLRELQTKMSNFKKMMSAFEDKLYKKYDAMEAALVKLGTQLSFITGGQ